MSTHPHAAVFKPLPAPVMDQTAFLEVLERWDHLVHDLLTQLAMRTAERDEARRRLSPPARAVHVHRPHQPQPPLTKLQTIRQAANVARMHAREESA